MNDLVYLTLVVRATYIDDYGALQGEIHIYSDNWLESFLEGVLHQSYRFTTEPA
jgi:hypothetical protein